MAKLANEEEFNNFMHRVTEISSIVTKLASEDKDMQMMGISEADNYLKEPQIDDEKQEIDEETFSLKVKSNKTLINKVTDEKLINENEMSKGKKYEVC